MSLKKLLGLEDTNISDDEILARIKDALDKNISDIEFTTKSGEKIQIRLPHQDFTKYLDPWDGKQGKGNLPNI